MTRALAVLAAGTVALAPLLVGPPAPASPPSEGLVRLAGGGLSISAPGSANLGSGGAGTTISGQLGGVTVSAGSSVLEGWSATVSLTSGFTVTQGGSQWTFPASRVRYWSGLATASSGITVGLCLPAQPTSAVSQTLTATRPAYSCGAVLATSSSLTWNPTVAVSTQAGDPSGTYTGTIVHSVS